MTFASLKTQAFRNLADSEVDTRGKDVFLVGENGQGKTNFLEALYFCSFASSFRGVRDGELIRSGAKDCSVSARLDDPLGSQIRVKIENNRKVITVDEKTLQDRKELLSVIPCIVFCHEDLEFVSGTPEQRRWFFDQTQSLYDPVYLEDLRKYRKILKTRNTVLKSPAYSRDSFILESLEPQLIQYGLNLMEKREEAVRYFSGILGPLYQDVSGIEGVEVRYIPSWKDRTAAEIQLSLGERRGQEEALGTSLSGPHRDRFMFIRGGRDFTAKASTGQRRLLALLLRVAQACLYSRMTGRKPVLLLDDVLLELDPEKKQRFLGVMPDYDQAFYTFLPEEPFERYQKSDTLVYQVHNGTFFQAPGSMIGV